MDFVRYRDFHLAHEHDREIDEQAGTDGDIGSQRGTTFPVKTNGDYWNNGSGKNPPAKGTEHGDHAIGRVEREECSGGGQGDRGDAGPE